MYIYLNIIILIIYNSQFSLWESHDQWHFKRTGGLSHWQVQLFIPSALCTEHIIIIIIIIFFKNKNKTKTNILSKVLGIEVLYALWNKASHWWVNAK